MQTITYRMLAESTPMTDKAIELLARGLEERHGLRLVRSDGRASITLGIRSSAGREGFSIVEAPHGAVTITGDDECGLLYGVGKYLRDRAWRGTTAPEKRIRAVFFATHFHNYYHDAPVTEICRYVEELALWGCNTLMVWFDMHHYAGIDDPAARAMITRLRAILETAQSVGMRPGLAALANEAYANSPPEMRADFRWQQNGYRSDIGAYGVEICPSKPGGIELTCRYRQEMLDAFAGLNIGLYTLGGYDQGGCTCPACRPWGANGYLRTAEAVARLVRRNFPDANPMLCTWHFDRHIDGEWEGLSRALAGGKPDWADYLLADDHGHFPEYPLKHGVPGGLPVISFPEISMGMMWPWGAFGANPRLAHWQQYRDAVGQRLAGSVCYSEGIYEDINKVLHLQHGWDSRRTMHEIAREYAASEFSPECADDAVTLMVALEKSLEHGLIFDAALGVLQNGGWQLLRNNLPQVYTLPRVCQPDDCAALADRIDAHMPEHARSAWRWRILWLRAALDQELHVSRGRPTAASDAYFGELGTIYHAANADWIVSPAGTADITRYRHALKPIGRLPAVHRGPEYSDFITSWRMSKLHPKTIAAAPCVAPGSGGSWQIIRSIDGSGGFINVHAQYGDEDGIAYLASTVRVHEAGRWILHVGHDGGVRVFIDGKAVLTVPERMNPATAFRSKTRIALGKGSHEIVIAFDTAGGNGWGFCCFFETLEKARMPKRRRPEFPRPVVLRVPTQR